MLLCDLLILYSTSSARSAPALQTLVHLPSDSLRSDMAAFLVDYIFSDSDDAEHNGQHVLFMFVLMFAQVNVIIGVSPLHFLQYCTE